MLRFILIVILCAAHVSCFPGHEEEEARVLSEVWEAMDKHRGDDIIVIPRRDGPGPEHHDSDHRSSDHHGPSHDGPSHDGLSDRLERPSRDTENTSESSEKSGESPDTSAAESSSSSSESSEKSSDESSKGHHDGSNDRSDESSYDKIWNKFNRIGDMMNRAVDRLRKDDQEIQELENEASGGFTVFILEIVGAVVVGLILVGLLAFGFVKGLKGFKAWKARRQGERLVDQEAPNMDGTGYQSGYNP